jgi:peptidyl-prolyl cis-trans isomerase D
MDENNVFQRIKYEKFLLENNISAAQFEQRLKDRELQKKLFDFIGAGTVSPEFLVNKLFKNENSKLKIDFIDLETFYKKKDKINNNELLKFLSENKDNLKIEYVDFKYSIINPQILIGINEFNQEFFDKIDEIENMILNGVNYDTIISEFNLNSKIVNDYKYNEESNFVRKKIYEVRNNKFDIFEDEENFILYKIENIQNKEPDLNDPLTKKEITELVIQKNKFDYNKKLLEKIKNKQFNKEDFLKLGKNEIQSHTFNSIKDNKKFEINSVQILYSLPMGSFTLISDEENNIYLASVKELNHIKLEKNTENYKIFIDKENTRIRNSILQSYDYFLNDKYNVNINQIAINNIKNLFQ